MSTRDTIATGDDWHLACEMISGDIELDIGPVSITLPPDLLEALQGVKPREPWRMAPPAELARQFGFIGRSVAAGIAALVEWANGGVR